MTTVWLLALGGLALFTANPVTLNRGQIAAADAVITGRVLKQGHRDVAVERVWKGASVPDRLRVANLSETPVKKGRTYLIPLARTGRDRYEVAATRRTPDPLTGQALPDRAGPPLVYPATSEALEQLRRILGRE